MIFFVPIKPIQVLESYFLTIKFYPKRLAVKKASPPPPKKRHYRSADFNVQRPMCWYCKQSVCMCTYASVFRAKKAVKAN